MTTNPILDFRFWILDFGFWIEEEKTVIVLSRNLLLYKI